MMKRILLIISIIFSSLCISVTSYAHSGNTDSYGGHYNHLTGNYHYHHGYPAHQHYGGACPYDYWWLIALVLVALLICVLLFFNIKNKIEEARERKENDRINNVEKEKTFEKKKRVSKLSNAEWETLYKTDFESFWNKVLDEVDWNDIPDAVYNFRTYEVERGDEGRKMYLARLKWAVNPSQSEVDKEWESLMELKYELEQKELSSSMYDVVNTYHSRYIRY